MAEPWVSNAQWDLRSRDETESDKLLVVPREKEVQKFSTVGYSGKQAAL